MDRVNVAIVGCGRISDLHEMGYRGRDDAAIVAVCDSNKRRARNKARDWGVEKVYTDYDQLLADGEVDLVELLVPHHLHAPMTVAACEAGKHVSVQKPMSLTVSEAKDMIAAAVIAPIDCAEDSQPYSTAPTCRISRAKIGISVLADEKKVAKKSLLICLAG